MKFTKKAIKLTAAIAGAVALGTAATVTTANADTIYTVQAGDTLSAISYKFFGNLDNVDQIAQKNNIANKNLIHIGEKLVIMDDGQIAPATASQIANLPAANQSTTQNQAATTTTSNTQSAASASTNNTAAASNNSAVTTQASASTNNTAATTQASASYNTTATTPAAASYSSRSSYTSSVSGNDASAKAWIAARESGGSYTARNGQCIGKYQLSASYLNGDYSAANQERVADQYVASRYGSWTAAQSFWQSHGWY